MEYVETTVRIYLELLNWKAESDFCLPRNLDLGFQNLLATSLVQDDTISSHQRIFRVIVSPSSTIP